MNGRANWFLTHLNCCYHLHSVRGILKLVWEQFEHNLTVENRAPDKAEKVSYIGCIYFSQNNFVMNNYRHRLFKEVLALFSAQKSFGSFSQSADERHLLATVPQLQSIHSGHQRTQKNKHYTDRRQSLFRTDSMLLLTFLMRPRCSLCWPLTGSRTQVTCFGSPERSCCWT